VAIALVLLAVVARRWDIARDIGLSAAGPAAVTGILIVMLGGNGGRPAGIVIDDYYLRFPVLQVALFMAVTTAALPYLARGVQLLIEIFIALVALACAAGGHGLPLNVLAAATLRPKVQDIMANLKAAASSPLKLVLLLGGSLGSELLVALALSVSLRAFDDHLRLPVLIVVITLAGILGGISPTPGGIGVVEAGMILGLTAAGVTEADATAAVFIQRLFTSYLPPIWGWATLVWMRSREYL